MRKQMTWCFFPPTPNTSLPFLTLTMPPCPSTQRAQPSTSKLGRQFQSPKRPRNKHYTQNVVQVPGQGAQHQAHAERLAQLLGRTRQPTPPPPATTPDRVFELQGDSNFDEDNISFHANDNGDTYDMAIDLGDHPIPLSPSRSSSPTPQKRHTHPDTASQCLYHSWRTILPQLVQPYLRYSSHTLGKPLEALPSIMSHCDKLSCEQKTTQILCLLSDCE